MRVGNVSHWFSELGGRPTPGPALQSDLDADVVIVGGGCTGLWSAHYLKQQNPDLDVVVLEAKVCGYGASGRNGGFLTRHLYWPRGEADAYAEMIAANTASVEQIVDVFDSRGLDVGQRRAGSLAVATTAAAWDRAQGSGHLDGEVLLNQSEASSRVNVANLRGAVFDPHTVRIQPGKLVTELKGIAEQQGVRIFEDTQVVALGPGQVQTSAGHTVRGKYVVQATEAYSASFGTQKRRLAPVNTSMVATEPLTDQMWQEIGWDGREMLEEVNHGVLYSQITEDGRLALGGRGIPYRFGSRTDSWGETSLKTAEALKSDIVRLFPALRDLRIDHLWCGVIGVPRDWRPSLSYDRDAGLIRATGFIGNGMALSHLAGESVADLILERNTPLTRLPWLNRTSRNWEIEPFRYIGINGMYMLYNWADKRERDRPDRVRSSSIATMASAISGKP